MSSTQKENDVVTQTDEYKIYNEINTYKEIITKFIRSELRKETNVSYLDDDSVIHYLNDKDLQEIDRWISNNIERNSRTTAKVAKYLLEQKFYSKTPLSYPKIN